MRLNRLLLGGAALTAVLSAGAVTASVLQDAPRDARRVRIVPGGPILVEGPVDMTTPDGHRVCSDRFMVAVCACRRSKNYPLCDTSHRRKVRPTDTDDAQG